MSLDHRLIRASGWLGLTSAAIGAVVFVGWVTHHDWLAFARPSPSPTKAAGAVALMLLGASLWLQVRSRRVLAGRICAGLALVLIGLNLLERPLGLGWFRSWPAPAPGLHPGAVGYGGSLALGLSACALLLLHHRRPWSPWLVNVIFALATAALFVRRDPLISGISSLPHMAADLAVAVILLATGIVLGRPSDLHVRLLFSGSTLGLMARRLFIASTGIPLLLGSVLVWALASRTLEPSDAIFLLVAGVVVCGFTVAFFSIETAAKLEHDREDSELARASLTAQLQKQSAELQETVAQRTAALTQTNAELKAAADANARLAIVAENTLSGVMIADPEGRIEWVNQAFTRLSGYSSPEVVGKKPGQFLQGPLTDRATVSRIRAAIKEGVGLSVQILNYHKTGRPYWVALEIQPVRNAAGVLTNFVGNQVDITAQQENRLRLQEANERLALATRSASLGVWDWDIPSDVTVWDGRTLEIYGLGPGEFKGSRQEWLHRIHPDDRNRALADFEPATVAGESYSSEFRVVRAHDHAIRHVQSRAIVQRDASGRPVRLIGTTRDVTTEREVTQALEAINKRLRLALRSTHFGVWELDVATERFHADSQVQAIFNVQVGRFPETSVEWSQHIHSEDAPLWLEQMRRAAAGEISNFDGEFRILRGDGALRTVEVHGYLERDGNERPVRLVGLIRDISEDKLIKQALEFAEQRWQLAIEGSNDSVWDWDIAGNQIYHDDRWPRMLGYEPGELSHSVEDWRKLVHPDDLARNEAEVAAHFAEEKDNYQHELRFRTKQGQWRWILDRGKVVRRGPDGQPLRMTGTHTDVTERRELEERLRKTEELASEVSRLAQIGGWEIDLETQQVTWTDSARLIHEAEPGFQTNVESMWDFYPPEAAVSLQAALHESTVENPSFDIEIPVMTAKRRRIWVRMLGHGEFRQGKAVSFRGAIQDITVRHESEQARRELEAQLFQAQKMETLGTLAGGIAHDFNNLLTGIIGYHELAADSVPEDHPARACLTEARNASLRARELVEQILTFGRHNAHGEHTGLDLPLVFEEARRFLRATLPANVAIELHYAANLPPVMGDATQLHQVILNLGSNAAHAMRQNGGLLRIALEPADLSSELALSLGIPSTGRYVVISVRDTGHGMDEATRRRIFDPFFTTKKTREGTGLGLAVVHGIVRSHRGAIDVKSAPGEGTEFQIYLPTSEGEHTGVVDTSEAAPHGDGEFVCVVDDEEVVGSCTRLVLESKGYRTLIFGSAEQCLTEMEGRPNGCAVLVTDQTMPGMQGTELAAAMRRIIPNLPVVIMSGYFSKISPQALDELGQVELLAKPFTTDELSLAVYRALHPPARTD